MGGRLLSVKETCDLLGVKQTSLRTPSYRQRIGLPVIRVGYQLRFAEDDISAFIARNREQLGGGGEAPRQDR
jgi:hypothetical protein